MKLTPEIQERNARLQAMARNYSAMESPALKAFGDDLHSLLADYVQLKLALSRAGVDLAPAPKSAFTLTDRKH